MFHARHAGHQPQCPLHLNSKRFIPDDAITSNDLALRVENSSAKLAIKLLVSKVSACSIAKEKIEYCSKINMDSLQCCFVVRHVWHP